MIIAVGLALVCAGTVIAMLYAAKRGGTLPGEFDVPDDRGVMFMVRVLRRAERRTGKHRRRDAPWRDAPNET